MWFNVNSMEPAMNNEQVAAIQSQIELYRAIELEERARLRAARPKSYYAQLCQTRAEIAMGTRLALENILAGRRDESMEVTNVSQP
jgi:hypothetical protein